MFVIMGCMKLLVVEVAAPIVAATLLGILILFEMLYSVGRYCKDEKYKYSLLLQR